VLWDNLHQHLTPDGGYHGAAGTAAAAAAAELGREVKIEVKIVQERLK